MNSNLSRISLAIAVALLAEGYASAGPQRIPVTPLGVRELQTRSFDNVTTHTAMKAVIDMLQDGGFTIERTDADLGLIVGTQAVVRKPSVGRRALKYAGAAVTYGLIGLIPLNRTDELQASVNVTGIDDDSVRVRISVQRRMLDKNGQLKTTEPLTEGLLYQDLFELLGRSLFVSQAQ
jgi:hypothetical protein